MDDTQDNEKLRTLRGGMMISEAAMGANVAINLLSALERGEGVADKETATRLATFYNVDTSELGFDELPESQRNTVLTNPIVGKGIQKANYENIPVRKEPMKITEDGLGKRGIAIIQDIMNGMSANAAWHKYGLDVMTYGVYMKIIHGGMSKGGHSEDDKRLSAANDRTKNQNKLRIRELHLKGLRAKEIAQIVGVNVNYVYRCIEKYKSELRAAGVNTE